MTGFWSTLAQMFYLMEVRNSPLFMFHLPRLCQILQDFDKLATNDHCIWMTYENMSSVKSRSFLHFVDFIIQNTITMPYYYYLYFCVCWKKLYLRGTWKDFEIAEQVWASNESSGRALKSVFRSRSVLDLPYIPKMTICGQFSKDLTC